MAGMQEIQLTMLPKKVVRMRLLCGRVALITVRPA